MNRFFTIMVVPEKDKKVHTIRIPGLLLRSFVLTSVVLTIVVGMMTYDYWKILQEVYENRLLSLENRQLKEQIQLFQMKVNSLTEDLDRIYTMERKLRVITGLEKLEDLQAPAYPSMEKDSEPEQKTTSKFPLRTNAVDRRLQSYLKLDLDLSTPKETQEFRELKDIYDRKIAQNLGLNADYQFTKEWQFLSKRSFELASSYALFDVTYARVRNVVGNIESNLNQLDQYLLDRKSFIESIPTLLPTRGWITSYYGPRKSPFSGKVRMHEGIDIGGPLGADIISAADGVVVYAGKKPGFGRLIEIDHGYGVETAYGHIQKIQVKAGDKVKRGQTICQVGNAGYSTGPHLHYEVRVNGTPVDPLYFVLNEG